MSDNPKRVKFEHYVKPGTSFNIHDIEHTKRAFYNRQNVGNSVVYYPNSSDTVRAFLFQSFYQPELLFIVIVKLKRQSNNTIHNMEYDSANGRSAHTTHRCEVFSLPETYIRNLPNDWNDSMINKDPFEVFNAGLEKIYQLDYKPVKKF
jgi:hypothetical protein